MIYPAVPRRVLFEWNYETPTWAKMLRAVEECGLEGVELLRRRKYESLTGDILAGLLVYLIAHTTRSPHHFEELRAKTAEDREVAFQTETVQKILNSGNVIFHLLEFPPSAVPLYLTDNPVSVLGMSETESWVTFTIASHLMISGISPTGEGAAWPGTVARLGLRMTWLRCSTPRSSSGPPGTCCVRSRSPLLRAGSHEAGARISHGARLLPQLTGGAGVTGASTFIRNCFPVTS